MKISLSVLNHRLALAKRGVARIVAEAKRDAQEIESLMADGNIWSEEDPARRNKLEALLKASESRLELLENVQANRDQLQNQYNAEYERQANGSSDDR